MKKTHSTREVAKLAKIDFITLHRWLSAGKVKASQGVPMDGRTLWRWTEADVEKVKKYKAENYRKGRGRKPKSS